MKKKFYLMATTFALLATSTSVFGGTIPKVNVNNSKILVKDSPFTESGRTFIPLRSVSENLGATVAWDAKTQTATITQGYTTIVQRVGSNTARVNNKIIELDASAKIKNGVTYVPVRFVAEALGGEIKFDKPSNTLNIEYKYPTDGGQKYDLFGRPIRKTNLPKNTANYSYIVQGVPNNMYEMKSLYETGNWTTPPTEPKNYIKAVNLQKYSPIYSSSNLILWKSLIEENLDLRLNVNYKTVSDTWSKQLAQTYMEDYYDRNLNQIKKYVSDMKKNNIIIEGDYYVEPSITYVTSRYTMRTWVKFIIKSDKVSQFSLYQNYQEPLKTNTWYEGYVDIGIGTNDGGSDGSDYKILRDEITLYVSPK